MLLRLARAGLGVTGVSLAIAQPYVARGELQRVLPDWQLPPVPCWAVFPERRLMPLRTRLFIEDMAQALARYPQTAEAEPQ
jgi:DNA-binding transcriptional LysR family regulator